MIYRNLFFKRKKKKKYLFLFLIILIFITLIIFYFNIYKKSKYIIIPKFIDNFYIIPDDRGGQKIKNLDKKSLNLSKKNFNIVEIDNKNELIFSIQYYTNSNYNEVIKYLNNISEIKENIYKKNDFYILALYTDIVVEYYLLYKNFNTKEQALKYCNKYLNNLNNCLIINVQNFNN